MDRQGEGKEVFRFHHVLDSKGNWRPAQYPEDHTIGTDDKSKRRARTAKKEVDDDDDDGTDGDDEGEGRRAKKKRAGGRVKKGKAGKKKHEQPARVNATADDGDDEGDQEPGISGGAPVAASPADKIDVDAGWDAEMHVPVPVDDRANGMGVQRVSGHPIHTNIIDPQLSGAHVGNLNAIRPPSVTLHPHATGGPNDPVPRGYFAAPQDPPAGRIPPALIGTLNQSQWIALQPYLGKPPQDAGVSNGPAASEGTKSPAVPMGMMTRQRKKASRELAEQEGSLGAAPKRTRKRKVEETEDGKGELSVKKAKTTKSETGQPPKARPQPRPLHPRGKAQKR